MTIGKDALPWAMSRRQLLAGSAGAGLLAAGVPGALQAAPTAQGALDTPTGRRNTSPALPAPPRWIRRPNAPRWCRSNYKGRLSYWYVGPNQASPQIDRDIDAAVLGGLRQDLSEHHGRQAKSRLQRDAEQDPHRGARQCRADGGEDSRSCGAWSSPPRGSLLEFEPEDVGYRPADFWPGAMKSVTWAGKTYGMPTNNETMALIWNAGLFQEAGLDPENAARDLGRAGGVFQTDQGEDRQERLWHGGAGQCGQHAVPLHAAALGLWRRRAGRGGGDPDLQEDHASNNAGSKAALQASYDMYVRDRSVPVSALTNTQTENQDPFIAGQLGDDDQPSRGIRDDAGPRQESDRRGPQGGRRGGGQYALWPDAEGPGAPRRGVRRIERARVRPGMWWTASWTSMRRVPSSRFPPGRNGPPSSPGIGSNPGNGAAFARTG